MLSFKRYLREAKESGVTTWAVLQHNDLTKYGGDRLQTFLQKIKDGEEFATNKGLVKIDKSEYERLKAEMPSKGYSTTIKAGTKTLKYPKDFYKTAEFGGKGKGAGTAAEDRYLSTFQKDLTKVLEQEKSPYINLKIGKRTVQAAGIRSTSQDGRFAPKADFTIYDTSGKGVAFISHKAGSTGAHFQQYGGVTNPIFNRIPEIQKFADDVKKAYPDGLTSGITLYRKVNDRKVLGLTIYGLEYGNKQRSKENVDEFHQGPMKLKKTSGGYTITSNHKGFNGDIPTGSHEAYYVARYTKATYLGIKNARVGVFPLGKIPRTAKKI